MEGLSLVNFAQFLALRYMPLALSSVQLEIAVQVSFKAGCDDGLVIECSHVYMYQLNSNDDGFQETALL